MKQFSPLVIILLGLATSSLGSPFERVVNGTAAKEGEFPYAISLRSLSGSHSCGGSIIAAEWVLTAAHCVSINTPQSSNIQYGVTNITATGPNIANISKVFIHEKYNPNDNYRNDIALLKLSQPLVFNDTVQPVKLIESKTEFPTGVRSLLVGWGYNDTNNGKVQTNLQKVDLIVFSDEDCYARHEGRTHLSHLCSGVPEGGKGQCSGDSGGPLTVNGKQVGIVSWSVKPCTIAPYPGVYTKVSWYNEWIEEKTGLKL